MSAIFEQLETIIDDHFLAEKVFVVPSHRDGKLAIQGLTNRGKAVINVKVKTFHDLVMEYVHPVLNEHQLTVMPSIAGKQFVFQALKQLKQRKELAYFKDVQLTPSFCHAFYQTLLDMKQVCVNLERFPDDAFLNRDKAQDAKKVFDMYEAKRKQSRLMDAADLFRLARSMDTYAKSETVYVYFPHEAYHLTEKEFFLHYTKGATVIPILLPEVEGAEALPQMIDNAEKVTTDKLFKNIYDVQRAIEEGIPAFSLLTTISEDEEIQSVFRRLKTESIPFDESVLFYTSARPYVESLLRLQQKMNLPITFGEGIPIELTKPGKLLKGVFRWIRDDFSVSALAKIIREDVLDYQALPFSGERVIKMLKDCNILWGKERYVQKVSEKLVSLEAERLQGKKVEGRIEELQQLQSWLANFLSYFQAHKTWDEVNFHEWLGSIKEFISAFAHAGKQFDPGEKQLFDKLAKEEMNKAIEQVMDVQTEILTLAEAMAFTEQWLMSLPVGARNPLPGHCHVASYRNGLYVDRKHMYIVGMDNAKFPGRAKEDPLLLDRERKKIHEEMTLGKSFVKRNGYLFVQLLLTAQGQVHFSFPFMDTVENRQSAPAHLFLQLFRMQMKDPDTTGEMLMEHMQQDVHFIKEDVRSMLQPAEWFGAQIWNKKELDMSLLQDGSFENILQGIYARNARLEECITEYDGLVEYEASLLDPRENRTMLSTSRLEQLGACPYSYFLRYVLKVEDEEEEEFDRYSWLDAAARGSVLHEVFETFYRTITEKKEKPSFGVHLRVIIDICDRVLLEKRESLLPPSEMVYELERQEMLESCSIFLKAEEEASEDGEPLFFEYTFGMDGEEPAVIELSEGKQLLLRGKIDRIDRLSDGTYSIIDYKTGSTYGYGKKNYFNGGRKLQHILYALAFEKLKEEEGGSVSSSVYVFPTVKGQGERAYRKHAADQRDTFLQLVDHLCNFLKNGHFPYTDNEDDCKFCSFKHVCRRHTYGEDLLNKKAQDTRATGWKVLAEVRTHD